jgi:hypothetical protein
MRASEFWLGPQFDPLPDTPVIGLHDYTYMPLLDPKPEDISIKDLLWTINRMHRFGGHNHDNAARRLTLADHSLHVLQILETMGVVDEAVLRTGFMHDAHETIVGDMASPLKMALRELSMAGGTSVWDQLEAIHMKNFAKRFDLIYPHPPEVKRADLIALAVEASWGWSPPVAEAWGLPAPQHKYKYEIPFRTPNEFRDTFNRRFQLK